MRGVAIGEDGTVDPQQQLFRSSAIGVETGPFISQVRGSAGECGEPVSNFVYAEEKDTWLEGCLLFHATYGYVLSIACVSVSGPAHPRRRTRILDRLESLHSLVHSAAYLYLKPGHW